MCSCITISFIFPLLILPSFCNKTIWVILIDDIFLQVGGYVYASWAIKQGCLRWVCLMICFRDSVSDLAQFGFVSVTERLRLVVGSLGLLCKWSWLPVCLYLKLAQNRFQQLWKAKVIMESFMWRSQFYRFWVWRFLLDYLNIIIKNHPTLSYPQFSRIISVIKYGFWLHTLVTQTTI